MAIAKIKPDAQPVFETTAPAVPPEPVKSNFTSLMPETKLGSLLKYAEGYPWTVNYYGQILNVDNTVELFDPASPNMTQPYYEILDMVIQVSSPLSPSYNAERGVVGVTGSAIMPFKVMPNVGDLFHAKVDDGEDALFHITSVTRKTHRKESLYEVSYALHSYINDTLDYFRALKNRVNETYYFNKDTNYFNRDVLIKPSVKEARERIAIFVEESKRYYFNTFTNHRIGSLVIPGQENIAYDPILVRFILKTVDLDPVTGQKLFQHAYASDELDQSSILDCLTTKTKPNENTMNPRYMFVNARSLPARSKLGTLSLAGVSDMLFPVEPHVDHFSARYCLREMVRSINPINSKNYDPDVNWNVEMTTNNNGLTTTPVLHSLFEDDYYVVSPRFYEYLKDTSKHEGISYTEFLLYKFLNGQGIHPEDLAVAVEKYQEWPLLHKLYLLPVYWLMIRVNI